MASGSRVLYIFAGMEQGARKLHITIPAGGICVGMYKYGMPYDTEHLEKLMQWLAKNNYELAGISSTCVCLILPFISRKQA